MNILFIGKWDIAGAYIADRLIREGNAVCWMTQEGENSLWNRRFKGNIYRGIWKREDYLHILKSNSIDTVFFLTGGFRENYEDLPDYESQMLDLTNVLNVLRNYPVKCLVYLSSVELDYEQVHTPVLTDLAAGEMLCEAYHNAYELPVLILRMGCVYGTSGLDSMGYTGRILKKLQQSELLESLYSPSDYVDVIYGEDAAVAVYRLLQLGRRGTYRLLTGQPLTMEEYYAALGKAVGCVPKVTWFEQKHTASREYFVSDERVKLETGWIPFYLLPDKGIQVLQKSLKYRKKEGDVTEEKKVFLWKLGRIVKKPAVRNTLETLLLFLLTTFLLKFGTDVSDLKYVDIRLMFVAIVSGLYGVRMGILAILLASLSYIGSLSSANVDVSYLLYSVDTWIPFVSYILAGAVIGYSAARRRDEMDSLQEKYSILSDKYEFIKSIQGETLEIKGQLQRQIITSKHSFGHAYEVAVELDSLKPELILLKVISILESIMECEKAAIFLVNSSNMHFARLKACSAKLRESIPNSMNMDQYDKLYPAFRESRMFLNTDLVPDYPDYAAPIYYREKLFGFVALYEIGSDKFTVYYQNLFKIITSLIEQNLVKALEYEKSRKEKLYFPETELLYPQAFEDRLSVMNMESDKIAYTYVQVKIYPKIAMDQKEVSERIGSVIRGSDFMGIDREGDYAVILVNMSLENLEQVRVRFERKDLEVVAV